MEHVVFFPAPDGTPAFRRLSSLDEAVRLVEHLRNVEGVQAVSVHALTEVPLSFRAYYRVEVPTAAVEVPAQAEAPALQSVPVDAAPPAVAPVPELAPAPVHPEPVLALVESPAEDEPAAEHVGAHEAPVEAAAEPAPEPALAASNGRGTPASMGFFA